MKRIILITTLILAFAILTGISCKNAPGPNKDAESMSSGSEIKIIGTISDEDIKGIKQAVKIFESMKSAYVDKDNFITSKGDVTLLDLYPPYGDIVQINLINQSVTEVKTTDNDDSSLKIKGWFLKLSKADGKWKVYKYPFRYRQHNTRIP